jgi:DNA-directed RNA polymerase specialized sigma24 family protein
MMVRVSPKPTFAGHDHIKAYLYKSLKNMLLSRWRRQRKDIVFGFPSVYFESIEFAIAAADRSSLPFVRSELAAICEYACMRRKSSRVGSALILRYFLGYSPDEITVILQWSRAQVHTNCETGRLEARAYLERPQILRFLNDVDRSAYSFPRELPHDTSALFDELMSRIFSRAEGPCLPPLELKERYQKGIGRGYNTNESAHLASCKACLDQASAILNAGAYCTIAAADGSVECAL